MYNGDWGKAPKSWGVFENFMSKVTLQYWGSRSTAGCITCSLNNFIGGAAAPSAPCFRVYGVFSLQYSLSETRLNTIFGLRNCRSKNSCHASRVIRQKQNIFLQSCIERAHTTATFLIQYATHVPMHFTATKNCAKSIGR